MTDPDARDRAVELARKARMLSGAGRYAEALELCSASIAADPTLAYPHAVIAAVELALSDANRFNASGEAHARLALDSARRAVSLAPESWWAHGLQARAAALLRDHQTSVASALQSVRLGPELWWTHHSLAVAYTKAGRFDEALKAAQEAVQVNPLNPECHKAVGRIRNQRREWPEAEIAFREALKLRADDDQALNDLYIAVKHQGRVEEAISVLEAAARINPNRAETRLNVQIAARSESRQHLSTPSKMISDDWEHAQGREPGQPRGYDWIDRARPHIRSNPQLANSIIDELRAQRSKNDTTVRLGDALLAAGRGESETAREIANSIATGMPGMWDVLLRDPDLGHLLRPRAERNDPAP